MMTFTVGLIKEWIASLKCHNARQLSSTEGSAEKRSFAFNPLAPIKCFIKLRSWDSSKLCERILALRLGMSRNYKW